MLLKLCHHAENNTQEKEIWLLREVLKSPESPEFCSLPLEHRVILPINNGHWSNAQNQMLPFLRCMF